MKHRFVSWLLIIVALLLLSTRLLAVTAQDTPPSKLQQIDSALPSDQSLLAKVHQQGRVDIIVGLNVSFRAEGLLTTAQASAQQINIQQAQAQFVSRIQRINPLIYTQYHTIPFVALNVDEAGLLAIMADPQVVSIEEDVILKPSVLANLDLIDADLAWVTGTGYTGAGQTVAVIDTGVQENHQEFGSRVIPAAEACFSSNDTVNNAYHSTCPGGVTSKTGAGAGAACTASGCFHGTHVAGTIAGSTTGVAPGASIIAINAATDYGANGAVLFSRDVISALEYVYSLRNTYSIAAVNMSIGGTADFRKYCDTPALSLKNGTGGSYKSALDNLVSVNIAPVIASGNAYYNDAIELPSCISSAVSVGASGNYETHNTTANEVASFSNSSYMIDLLAPGVNIYSALPGSTYGYENGTSMAAPHVSGAWAILKQREPGASVTRILTAFQTTGVSITDSKNGVTRPRIDVDNALNALISGSIPVRPNIVINEVDTGTNAVIELYNKESTSVTLTGWKLETYTPANALEINYTFPSFTLASHSYVQLREGSNTNTATTLYLNSPIGTWSSGAVILKNSGLSIDFVRWGSSTVVPPLGSTFLGNNPPAPSGGSSLGRTNTSLDRDEGADWFTETATLGAVNVNPAVVNDSSASPVVISSLPFNYSENTTLATSTGDPNLNLMPAECATNLNSVWFRYTASADQVIQFDTNNSDYDTVITVWKNFSTTPTVVACDDDNGSSPHTSLVNVPVTNGTVYDIQITGGFISESGFLNFHTQVVNVPANDTPSGAIDISPIPSEFTQTTLLATDDGDLFDFDCFSNTKSVWYKYVAPSNTPVILDTRGSDFDTLINVYEYQSGTYNGVACNDDYYLDDNTSHVGFVPTTGKTYYIMISGGLFTDSGNLVLNTSYAPPPPANDAFASAVTVGALPWSTSEDTSWASLDASDPAPGCQFGWGLGIDGTVWYKYIAASSKTIRLSTAGSDFSTLISVWTKQPGFVEKACSDGFGGTTQVDVTTTAGTTYYLMIGGTLGTIGGNLNLSVSDVSGAPLTPTLLTPPNNTQNADTTPTFTWQAVTGATTYDIGFGTGNPPVFTVTGLTQTSYTPPALVSGVTYHWRVRSVGTGGASAWSSVWSYTIPTGADAVPTRNLFTVLRPMLTWAPVTWAVSYELEVDTDTTFTAPLSYSKTSITAGQFRWLLDQDLGQGTYYWHVRAIDANGRPGAWSTPESFIILLP